ncbi:anti-sigma factor [Janthinobacterium sp.]|uniref:anti-sigma factor family protein n=1 Tax=Janthinobacterium sp. TaxID=1871054 RepID=UPI00293D414B|nr:anti-sigma factor [Janthinobacterium sp.]
MKQHDDEQDLSAAIKAQATRHRAPPGLRERILADLAPPAALSAAPLRARWRDALRMQWARLGAAFVCGALVALALVAVRPPSGPANPLAQEVVAGHVRSLMVDHLEDVASTDQHTVKPWFAGKLDFSPPVHDLAKDGYPLIGGRLDYLDHRPVAALVYRSDRHTINVFVWPADGAAAGGMETLSRQGFNIVAWRANGMRFWAVSDLNAGQLQAFAQKLRASAASFE